MLKIIGLLALVGLLAGLAFGAADDVDVGGGSIQHGVDQDLQCDEDGVRIDGWAFNADEDAPGYGILNYVRVLGIDPSCECCSLWVSLWDGDTFLGRSDEAHIPGDGDGDDKDPATDQVGVKAQFYGSYTINVQDIDRADIFIEGGCPDAPI